VVREKVTKFDVANGDIIGNPVIKRIDGYIKSLSN